MKAATADVGVREVPLGSNTGERVGEMQSNTWLGGWRTGNPSPMPIGSKPATTRWPWCVASWLTWALTGGFTIPYRGAGAWAFYDWAKSAGWATTNVTRCQPGDGVVWNIGEGHMSQFRSYDKASGMVKTMDGNVSDRVEERARPLSLVRGFVVLPEQAVAVGPVKPPVFEVVTSENSKVVYVSGARAIGRKIGWLLAHNPGGLVIRRRHSK